MTVGSVVEDDFNKANGNRSDVVGDGLDVFGSDVDDDKEQNP